MRFPMSRDDLAWLGRFALAVEGAALLVAFVLGVIRAIITRSPLLDSFLLMTFLVFLFMIVIAVLSGPGMFLSRPKFAPLGPEARARWRGWLSVPQVGKDQEFFELVLLTGLAFLLLAIATGIGALVGALGR